MRLWLVARAGAGWRAATYSIFVDRAVGLIALADHHRRKPALELPLIADPQGRSRCCSSISLRLPAASDFSLSAHCNGRG